MKPTPGVNSRLKFAVWPAVIEAEVLPELAGVIVKAGLTIAAMVTVCGESGASSVMVMLAERAPRASGENATPMLQAAFTA